MSLNLFFFFFIVLVEYHNWPLPYQSGYAAIPLTSLQIKPSPLSSTTLKITAQVT